MACLNRSGNDALLLADIALDDQKCNTNDEYVTWETSSMRSWLNGYGASMNEPKTDYSKRILSILLFPLYKERVLKQPVL